MDKKTNRISNKPLNKKLKSYFTSSVLARLIASILLLIALSSHKIGYYEFLRWVVCATAIYTAFISFAKKEKMNIGVWVFGLIAILFNPVIPFYLSKSSWHTIDIFVAILFFISTFFVKEGNN